MNPNDDTDINQWSSSTELGGLITNGNHDPSESISLPSLPLSLQAQLDLTPKTFSSNNQAMSMKEIDAKLNALRRENFDLKLRLFYERQNKANRRQDEEPFGIETNDKNLTDELQKLILERDNQLKSLKDHLLQLEKAKDMEISCLQSEKNSLAGDLHVITSLCRSFMNHLSQARDLWSSEFSERPWNSEIFDSILEWINSSEDLLNTASVLLTDGYDASQGPRYLNPPPKVLNRKDELGNSVIDELNLGEAEKKEYLKYKSLLYDIESDSEDEWSEPDRDVSKSRIGIDTVQLHQPSLTPTRSPPKFTHKRLSSSGLSSLAILSDLSELISQKKRKSQIKPELQCTAQTQTLLVSEEVETLISCFQNVRNKTFQTTQTQTSNEPKAPNRCSTFSQTECYLCESSSQTCDPCRAEKDSQTLISLRDEILTNKNSHCATNMQMSDGFDSNELRKEYTPISTRGKNSVSSKIQKDSDHVVPKGSPPKDSSHLISSTIELSNSLFFFTKSLSVDASNNMNNSNDLPIPRSKSTNFEQNKLKHGENAKNLASTGQQTKLCDSYSSDKLLSTKDGSSFRSKNNQPFAVEPFKTDQLSSPDLGIGDSDPDAQSPLRAYLPLGYYQLLRGHINQMGSYLNCLDNLFRDRYTLFSINENEYSLSLKAGLSNLNQLVNSTRSICKNFVIEDENSLFVQLEKIKAKKENMEKAITRQLKKTDKLLKKARINLKEN